MRAASETVRPVNFRTHKFHLFDKDIQIGGMASPDKNRNKEDKAMQYLKQNESVDVIIGLKEMSYADLATRNGIEYRHLPIQDFSIAPPETYDTLYQHVKEATEQGKKVTIHCGAGDGRTGTALASLKLREVMLEAALKDPSILDEESSMTATVDMPSAYSNSPTTPCTPFVKAAVDLTRHDRIVDPNNPSDHSGHHSVETKEDIEALMLYEKHLIPQIKEELRARQALSQDIDNQRAEELVGNIDSEEHMDVVEIQEQTPEQTHEQRQEQKLEQEQKPKQEKRKIDDNSTYSPMHPAKKFKDALQAEKKAIEAIQKTQTTQKEQDNDDDSTYNPMHGS